MGKPTLLLLGAGGHARSCIDVIERQGVFDIAGLVGTRDELGRRLLSYPVVGTDEDLDTLAKVHRHALVAVGQIASPETRMRLHRLALAAGFELPAVVALGAYVSPHATVGAGSIVMHGAIVNAGADIGANCIVNSRALLEHDVRVGDHCHVSTGAVVNGGVQIGAGSFIGSGCVIREGVRIGSGCVVGMGLALRQDLADHARWADKAGHG